MGNSSEVMSTWFVEVQHTLLLRLARAKVSTLCGADGGMLWTAVWPEYGQKYCSGRVLHTHSIAFLSKSAAAACVPFK
jgi:hypothetical protein